MTTPAIFPLSGSLYFSPPPYPREAMSSWLHRTATAHRCSWGRMRGLLGLKDSDDVDFVWPWELESSARFLAVSVEGLGRMLAWRQSFVAQAGAWALVMGSANAPRYSVCVRCAREQKAIHYCVENRFSFVTLCPLHRAPMFAKRQVSVGGESLTGNWVAIAARPRSGSYPSGHLNSRFDLERRLRDAVKIGYERHPKYGVVPVQTLLAAEAWRLFPGIGSKDALVQVASLLPDDLGRGGRVSLQDSGALSPRVLAC
jgi:hypothetical protein